MIRIPEPAIRARAIALILIDQTNTDPDFWETGSVVEVLDHVRGTIAFDDIDGDDEIAQAYRWYLREGYQIEP